MKTDFKAEKKLYDKIGRKLYSLHRKNKSLEHVSLKAVEYPDELKISILTIKHEYTLVYMRSDGDAFKDMDLVWYRADPWSETLYKG